LFSRVAPLLIYTLNLAETAQKPNLQARLDWIAMIQFGKKMKLTDPQPFVKFLHDKKERSTGRTESTSVILQNRTWGG